MKISKNTLRKKLFKELSEMYAAEVPLYDKLLETVKYTNKQAAQQTPELDLSEKEIEELSSERHGAIRLGKPEEMAMMARFFNSLDMQPVNFYNLADAGSKSQPVISTAFRPVKNADHRVFCSLLMTDYFDKETEEKIKNALKDRQIFSAKLKALIEISEKEDGLNDIQAKDFINEAKKLFGWRGTAIDYELYNLMVEKKFNIAADIACFPNPHLNHLTPNSLDIDLLYSEMNKRFKTDLGILSAKGMKDSIEGPPAMKHLVLLRQTSYKALDEKVEFTNLDGTKISATHTARFGEIEQRGIALTPKGRAIYDRLISENKIDYKSFTKELPDNYNELRKQELAYFKKDSTGNYKPIRYEDFLPVSAAGIFASNLSQYGTKSDNESRKKYTKELLETYMEKKIIEADDLYKAEALQ
ncbi:MAG TPA: DUF1338 domain-containing protein [Alphaproteobacteria bacterium]|nr:DUF1338 domain-containing protein [Alphaproteobacteria bacterium]